MCWAFRYRYLRDVSSRRRVCFQALEVVDLSLVFFVLFYFIFIVFKGSRCVIMALQELVCVCVCVSERVSE